jgi:hypothetical protein
MGEGDEPLSAGKLSQDTLQMREGALDGCALFFSSAAIYTGCGKLSSSSSTP